MRKLKVTEVAGILRTREGNGKLKREHQKLSTDNNNNTTPHTTLTVRSRLPLFIFPIDPPPFHTRLLRIHRRQTSSHSFLNSSRFVTRRAALERFLLPTHIHQPRLVTSYHGLVTHERMRLFRSQCTWRVWPDHGASQQHRIRCFPPTRSPEQASCRLGFRTCVAAPHPILPSMNEKKRTGSKAECHIPER